MSFLALFLSPRGRVGRLVYFLGILANFLAVLAMFLVADSVRMATGSGRFAEVGKGAFIGALGISVVLALWSLLAFHVRRAADQNLGRLIGALVGLVFIASIAALGGLAATLRNGGTPPFVGTPVAFAVVLTVLVLSLVGPGLIRGTAGANRFGGDPGEAPSKDDASSTDAPPHTPR